MQKILLTGANGMLGGKLCKALLETTDFGVIACASSPEKIVAKMQQEGIPADGRVEFLSNTELISDKPLPAGLYGAVHMAFARRIRPAEEIAGSIDFAAAVFHKLAASDVQRVINLSSQGIYGSATEFRTEETVPAPANQYTMAKYAAEVIFNAAFAATQGKDYTNVRLDLVVQSQNLVVALCKQAKNGVINLKGGEQRFSFIDADDAVTGIVALLQAPGGWQKVYNLGWNRRRYTLVEVAEIVADTAQELGVTRPQIVLDRQNINLWAGMDSTAFTALTGWTPTYDLKKMTKRIFSGV